jgi:hypothetical protein
MSFLFRLRRYDNVCGFIFDELTREFEAWHKPINPSAPPLGWRRSASPPPPSVVRGVEDCRSRVRCHLPPVGLRGRLAGIRPQVSALLREGGGRFLGASLDAAAPVAFLRPCRSGAGGSDAPLVGSGAGGARGLPRPLDEVWSVVTALASVVGASLSSARSPCGRGCGFCRAGREAPGRGFGVASARDGHLGTGRAALDSAGPPRRRFGAGSRCWWS